MQKTIKTVDVIYREDLYPRTATNPEKVQEYAQNIEMLPPIEVNPQMILIDGWHRWTAHKKNKLESINITITETSSDADIKLLAAERNSQHGWQMSPSDKKDFARSTYHSTPTNERKDVKKRLEKALSITGRTLNNWLSRIDKDSKKKQKDKIFDLWMSCHTQQEIAEAVGISIDSVKKFKCEKENFPISTKYTFSESGYKPPIYDVWKKQKKTNKVSHFGNSESQWLENLMYLYTDPFDVVVDPFAGGGSTIDVCKERGRRYFVSDRKPIVEREHEIKLHDIAESGLPKPPMWKDVKLVYLDPPYWKQAENQYSKDPSDLANMELELFNKTLSSLINKFSKKLQPGSYIALIIQPTQWNSPGKVVVDHILDMVNAVKLPVKKRYSVPYESQQCNAQMVVWAKENKETLVLTREIIVWEV